MPYARRRITDEDIQKVRDASDIVAVFSERVPVKQRGRRLLVLLSLP